MLADVAVAGDVAAAAGAGAAGAGTAAGAALTGAAAGFAGALFFWAIIISTSNCTSETFCMLIGCLDCVERSIARMTSTVFSSRSEISSDTCMPPLRSSSSSVSQLCVKEAMSEKPKVALPPLMECATRKMVLISSGSGAPMSS